jgi:hypothetical protein
MTAYSLSHPILIIEILNIKSNRFVIKDLNIVYTVEIKKCQSTVLKALKFLLFNILTFCKITLLSAQFYKGSNTYCCESKKKYTLGMLKSYPPYKIISHIRLLVSNKIVFLVITKTPT